MSSRFSRRSLIGRAVAFPFIAAAAVRLGSQHRSAFAASPIARAGGAKLKTSLNVYSFNKLLSDQLQNRGPGMSLLDVLDFCAEQGFDAVDPTGYFFPCYPQPPTDKYVNDFKRRAFQLGLDISGTGVRNNFATPDSAKRAADVQHVKEWIEVAARLGAPVLRVFTGSVPEGYAWDEVARWMADDLRKCAEHGEKFGVLIGIQNHGDMLKTADEVLKLLELVDSTWCGPIVDTGYFMTADPYSDIAKVAPLAVNWQIKERLHGKKGDKTDLKRIVQIARASGYRGYIPIETLSSAGEINDPRQQIPRLLQELRQALDQPV